MADFSALCPLFNTGVYGCVTFPMIPMSTKTTSAMFNYGFNFGRSVIITHAFVQKVTAFASTCTAVKIKLAKAAAYATTYALRTVFASYTLSGTSTVQATGRWLTMTVTAKTFSATSVLHVHSSKSEANAKNVNVIIRYKER
jgi:hypothetical protein